MTSEGTEFKGGRCLACGRASYGMADDGPRCHGCKRFVLKDAGAGGPESSWEEHVAVQAAPDPGPLTLAKLDALLEDAPSPVASEYFLRQAAQISRMFGEAFFADPPKPKRRRQKPLKTAEVMAEAEAILAEGRKGEG